MRFESTVLILCVYFLRLCGEYLVLLNNDVVVTDGWLDQLVGLVNASRGPDAQRAGASGHASADAGGRPTVRLGAGSGLAQRRRRRSLAVTAALSGPRPLPLPALCPVLRGPPPLTPPSQGGER